jgi:heterodisulfide reductase subunit C
MRGKTMISINNKNKVELLKDLEESSGQKIASCYQCGKCTAGCPLHFEMDYAPNQILRLLQVGEIDKALGSKTIWLCASCEACTTRCPRGVDLVKVMDALKIKAVQEKKKLKLPQMSIFINLFLKMVEKYGRLYEIGLCSLLNTAMLNPFKDASLAPFMFLKGKLKLFPNKVKNVEKIREVFNKVRELEERIS